MDRTILEKRYNDYSSYIKKHFSERVQKITLNTGFTCPNRDGSKGVGGCTYCNNNSFNPNFSKGRKSVTEQIEEGMNFFKHKNPGYKYLAYFQSYTNTYADIELIRSMYLEAVAHPNIVGLVIGTRPDCISEEIIAILSDIAQEYYVSLEFGIESTLDRTLSAVNRCHTFAETKKAYFMAADKGIHLGGHIILGLPGETRQDVLNHAKTLSELPIDTLKIHHLQIVKHTMMEKQYRDDPTFFDLFTMDEYIDLVCEFVAHLRPDIVIERFISESPGHLLVAPQWGRVKNFEIVERIRKNLTTKDLFQGKYYV